MLICIAMIGLGLATASELTTNSVQVHNAPKWLNTSRLNKVVDKIQRKLEWDIRRVAVQWYSSESEFSAVHGYGSSVLAVAKKSDNTVYVGPRVTTENFDSAFGHELVHVILFQKYKEAIPKWLEEGLANYLSGHGKVDYKWLATQPTVDIKGMVHPFKATVLDSRFHYMASTALIETIASKCNLQDLLQLSVGEKLESYLETFCGISDINAEYKKRVIRLSSLDRPR